jgi:hypothetical protein
MRLRVFGIALLTAVLSGCWVLDEIDEGNKKIDMYTAKGGMAEEPEPTPAPTGKRQRVGEYFANQKNTRTFTPGSVSTGIVSCRIKGSTQFMKQEECINRGGVPAG